MSIMQGYEEGFQGFQNIRVICGPLHWYQFAKILTLAHGLVVNKQVKMDPISKRNHV